MNVLFGERGLVMTGITEIREGGLEKFIVVRLVGGVTA
jgi:hypothetical protein